MLFPLDSGQRTPPENGQNFWSSDCPLFGGTTVYLKDYCEATLKLSMEEKWLKCFADTKDIDQKPCLIKLREYAFAIPIHNANVERIFSQLSTRWSDE
ncbi:hypothetical protein AVEN_145220-1 [Araneus ventricosus]|uniref:HAT C-terminal dimerisation domain-containing protein n=1 Tax=Araneus ventricosus TaxID=182803 RepID=A0A4Y2CET2_ARAVE|nr:hypothetical protein AVEN_64435-1 [Araneus ventricosus]GBM02769.1 hypothetical protein AVEN_145220-1 [Araneus ventricosus]